MYKGDLINEIVIIKIILITKNIVQLFIWKLAFAARIGLLWRRSVQVLFSMASFTNYNYLLQLRIPKPFII